MGNFTDRVGHSATPNLRHGYIYIIQGVLQTCLSSRRFLDTYDRPKPKAQIHKKKNNTYTKPNGNPEQKNCCHASLMLKQGIHLKIVQERLGHASISMTLATYSHVAPGLQQAAAENFDRLLHRKVENEAVETSVSKMLAKRALQSADGAKTDIRAGQKCTVVAHTGFEPVVFALRGRCPGPLDECATKPQKVAGDPGFEPGLPDSESGVLPLD